MRIDIPAPVLWSLITGIVLTVIGGIFTLRGIIVRAHTDKDIAVTQAQATKEGTFSEITEAWDKAMDRIEKMQTEAEAQGKKLAELRQEFDEYRSTADLANQAQTVKLAAVGRVLLAIARQTGPRFRPRLDPVDVQLLEHEMPPEWIAEHLPDAPTEPAA